MYTYVYWRAIMVIVAIIMINATNNDNDDNGTLIRNSHALGQKRHYTMCCFVFVHHDTPN